MGDFRDLIAHQRAVAFAEDLRAAIRSCSSLDTWTIGVQLLRSADSVGANLAEAFGRSSKADQLRFLLFARGSAYELQRWIERAIARSLLPDEGFRGRAWEVGRLVNGLQRAHVNRPNS